MDMLIFNARTFELWNKQLLEFPPFSIPQQNVINDGLPVRSTSDYMYGTKHCKEEETAYLELGTELLVSLSGVWGSLVSVIITYSFSARLWTLASHFFWLQWLNNIHDGKTNKTCIISPQKHNSKCLSFCKFS